MNEEDAEGDCDDNDEPLADALDPKFDRGQVGVVPDDVAVGVKRQVVG